MLALYLWNEFNCCGYDVDCEYNRNLNPESSIDEICETYDNLKKRIFDCKLVEGLERPDATDTTGITVFPDIIIHKRCSKNNLIAIEVKKITSSKIADSFDSMKLNEYVMGDKLKYNYSLFIKIITLTKSDLEKFEEGSSVKIGIKCVELRNETRIIDWHVPDELTKEINKESLEKLCGDSKS